MASDRCLLYSLLGVVIIGVVLAKPSNHHKDKYHNDVLKDHEPPKAAPHKEETCFYETCDLGKPDMLNVHLIAHAHNDLGYRKTVDQYYYGALDFIIQPGAVQYILDTVTLALDQNPQRRFIFVEVGFLMRWWRQQENTTKEAFTQMVHDGRMELVMGGWGSNDEGTNHYSGMIDHMAIGLKWLRETFGDKCGTPRVAWQIDEFGQSREQTSLFAMMGFDGLFFGRISLQDKEKRMADKTLEHMWFGSSSLGEQSAMFTGILYNRYEPPWTIWPLEPIMDDPRLSDYNVDRRVRQFVQTSESWAQSYSTNHIMMLIGADFEYMNAFRNFKNIDKLIKYVNQEQQNGSMVNAIMSTPTCYLYALNQANQSYTTKTDDFMPLEDNPGSIWTGYFTSRPNLKRYERTSNGLLQACKQWDTVAQLGQRDNVFLLAEEVAIMQHHDALTGTCKQPVAYDYALRLSKGNDACHKVGNDAYQALLPLDESVTAQPPSWSFCDLRNVSYCALTENNQAFTVLTYNQMGYEVTSYIRVPVAGSSYSVSDSNLAAVPAQLVPVSAETAVIPDRTGSIATQELVFRTTVPALGFSTYFVQDTSQETHKQDKKNTVETNKEDKPKASPKADQVLENEFVSITFDEVTKELKSFTNKEQSLTVQVTQALRYYRVDDPGEGNESNRSTVYKFFPHEINTLPVAEGAITTSLVQGALVQEYRQVFSDWASQVFRLYEGERHVEVEWTVGPIPMGDGDDGKEVVSLYQTNLNTAEMYYTDSNGREMMTRRRNFQPTFDLDVSNEVSANYYPINSRAYIRDDAADAQLAVLTDRSHGGGSIRDGELEVMLHRRFNGADTGVDEVFDEPGIDGRGIVARGRHLLLVDRLSAAAQSHRETSQRLFSEPIITFAEQTLPPSEYAANFFTERSFLAADLPPNVHLLTLETLYDNQVLLRLEHYYENDEGPMSGDATVALRNLFPGFTITSVEEMTLGANRPLASVERLQWNVDGYGRTASGMTGFVTPVDPVTLEVTLRPMQIRTFVLQVQYA